jgi:hypothetical protein
MGSVDERDFQVEVFFCTDPANQPIGNGAAPGSGEVVRLIYSLLISNCHNV